ncbi:hypothetical protein SBOR_6216 [Sclerotinia borealis F-4128]|uniref:Uncharacterized protein n=1 Tax=Sclerotinia borealis (strain F-4128) TaxID=1432307 RepID=W9CC12_SCLBF|nr:hypothetical protein SBOR_6216 [Sclerotinia borealis F-4128]
MSKSSNSDNNIDKISKDNPSDSDNPFIRFRHFADEHLSSILQGFIGLPSAFAKPQSSSQWSVFDEDLRRRDELQVRQRELKEAEERRSGNMTTSNDEVQIPVKKSSISHNEVDFHHPPSDRRMNVFGSYDVPLYSPLHSPMSTPFSGDLRHTMGSFAAVMLYQADPSDISLVPYLFGSPYSPLSLSLGQSMMRELGITKTSGTSGAIPRDDFPYCEAFEDLLLTSQGRDTEVRTRCPKSVATEASRSISSSVENRLDWIERLRRLGILHLHNSDLGNTSNESRSSRQEDTAHSHAVASSVSRPSRNGAETEEHMYENFLNDASTTPDKILTTLESTHTTVEKLMKGKNMPFEDSPRASPSGVKEADTSEKAISEPTESKREVSSHSAIEHFTDEDGSVETTIYLWKRFADGSETETSSSHTVDQATRQCNLSRTELDSEEHMSSQQKAGTHDQENESQTKKNTKSGWFWN